MNRRRLGWFAAGLLLGGIASVQAQEPTAGFTVPDGGGWESFVPPAITMPEAIPFSQWNASPRIKPANWEQLLNEKVARERAWEQSVLLSGRSGNPKQLEVNSRAAVWNFRIGNSQASWSISASSHLDARTLMFPAPRNMHPNRPTGSRVTPNGQIKR